jgi:hypothetical protein
MIPAHKCRDKFQLCPQKRELMFRINKSKDTAVEPIHVEMYQNRHFSFRGSLLGAMDIYVHSYQNRHLA